MALQDITEKIIADARKKEKKILKEADREVEKIQKEFEERKKQVEEENTKEIEYTLKSLESKFESEKKHKEKLRQEKEKRAALDEIFNEAYEALVNLSDDEYKSKIKKFAALLPKNKEGVFTLPEKNESRTKEALEEAGYKNIESETSDDFRGGFIFSSGNVVYDFSFKHMLVNQKNELEVEVARILFS